jgi:GNAT superfamily N-acetyltransferase
MDAYAGTVEGVGQDPSPQRGELERWFKGALGRAMPECSTVAWTKGRPEGACLVGWLSPQSVPGVQYVFTRAAAKRRGFGGAVLMESLRLLADSGHREVRALITQGNEAAEGLFQKAGFVPVLIA